MKRLKISSLLLAITLLISGQILPFPLLARSIQTQSPAEEQSLYQRQIDNQIEVETEITSQSQSQSNSQTRASRLTLTRDRTVSQEDLEKIATIDLNSHTLTISDGWLIESGQVSIIGPGEVKTEGEIPAPLQENPAGEQAYIVVGTLQESEDKNAKDSNTSSNSSNSSSSSSSSNTSSSSNNAEDSNKADASEPAAPSLSIGPEVSLSSSQSAPVLVASNGSLTNSGSISNSNTSTNGNQSAIILGLPASSQSQSENTGAALVLEPASKVNSALGTAITVLSQAQNVSIWASNASITGGASKGIGLDFAGQGKATISNTGIEAALAVLNTNGALSIINPEITSLGSTANSIGQAGYGGPDGAIVNLLPEGDNNTSYASISLSGSGTVLENSSAAYSILLSRKDGSQWIDETDSENKDAAEDTGQEEDKEKADKDNGSIVSITSSGIDFSKPVPPGFLANHLAIQLSNQNEEQSRFFYTDQTLDELLTSYMEEKTDDFTVWTADTGENIWNQKGLELTFNNANIPWLSYNLYIADETQISLPSTSIRPAGRLDYRFLGWSESSNGSPISTYTSQNTANPLAKVDLYAIWQFQGDTSGQKPDLFQPVTTSFLKTEQNQSWFEADSGINAGMQGYGPGFSETGSASFLSLDGQNQYTYCQNENGTKAATMQNSDGMILQSVLTIPENLIAEQTPIEVSLGENTRTANILQLEAGNKSLPSAPRLVVNLPFEASKARVDIPVVSESRTPGSVALKITGETNTPVAKSFLTENTISIPVLGSENFIIADDAKTFSDVADALEYAKNAASFVSARDLMTGMGEVEPKPFDFTSNLSRGQFATILWRLQGSPATEGDYPEGIEPGAWNADAARWAFQQGLMAQGNSLFQAQADITREQIVTILWRYEHSPLAGLHALDSYRDVDELHSTDFKLAMAWGVNLGLVGQGTNDLLKPKANATRMEIAAIFERFIEKVY